jgi:hypothetical protein
LCFLDIKATHENRGTLYDLARTNSRAMFHAPDRWWRSAQPRGCAQPFVGRSR